MKVYNVLVEQLKIRQQSLLISMLEYYIYIQQNVDLRAVPWEGKVNNTMRTEITGKETEKKERGFTQG